MKNVPVIPWSFLFPWRGSVVVCLIFFSIFCTVIATVDPAETEEIKSSVNSHDPPKIYGTHPVPATGNLQKHGERVDMLIQKRLGMAVRSITAEEASTFHLNPGERLVIKRLNPTSSAAYSGLEVNDILLEINGQPIIGLEHLTRVIRPMGHRQRVVMFVLDHRTGRKGYVQIYTR